MLLSAKFSGERFFCFALHKQNYTEYILKKKHHVNQKNMPDLTETFS